jgi:general secretion pathway protein D
MVLYQEVSRVQDTGASGTTTATLGPTLQKRSLESSVIVDDNAFVVLGGLIQDSLTGSVSKVPLLGDIPYLGALFRYDNRTRTKTNLLVFLKPTVVRTAGGAAALTNERYDFLLREQEKMRPEDRLFWRDSSTPQLPPLSPARPPSTPAASASPGAAPAVAPAAPANVSPGAASP